jgi:hypothetical protein
MRILIPARGSDEHFETPKRSPVVIDDLIADEAILEVASRQAGTAPLRFTFHGFTISDVGSNAPAVFKATLSNLEPPGEIATTGKFGPWNADEHQNICSADRVVAIVLKRGKALEAIRQATVRLPWRS